MQRTHIKTLEGMKTPTGRITLRSLRGGTVDMVNAALAILGKGEDGREMVRRIVSRNTLTMSVQNNLVMQGSSTGKDLLVKWLLSGYTAVNVGLGINYGMIGTGATAPAISDTQLVAEVARVVPTLATETGYNQANLQFFFADASLANNTYREFGTAVGGTSFANTGSIFNRALFTSAYVKVSGTDTTVELDITFT